MKIVGRRKSHRACAGKKGGVDHKPGSVVGNHSSGIHVAVDLERPTRKRARISAALSRRLWGLR